MAVARPWAQRRPDGWVLRIRAQPGASRSMVAGVHGDQLRVRIAAPANEGKANAELIRFLARQLGVPQRSVRLSRGEKGRSKVVEVPAGVDLEALSGN